MTSVLEQRTSSVNRINPDTFPAEGLPVFTAFTAITSSETGGTWSRPADTALTASETNPRNGIIRYFDPVAGRWLSNDPIGISGGFNQYVFCANNPVNARDPFGFSGTVTVYSDPRGGGSLSGHAYITYTSDSTGQIHAYGTYGNNPLGIGNGLQPNYDLNYPLTSSAASRSAHIDDTAEASLMNAIQGISNEGGRGWGYLSPCSDFASDMWDVATGENLRDRNWFGISNPKTLANSITKANGGKANGTKGNDCGGSSSK
jgi:RHS repeat-associated protein